MAIELNTQTVPSIAAVVAVYPVLTFIVSYHQFF